MPLRTADPAGRYDTFLRLAARLIRARVEPDSVAWADNSSPALFATPIPDGPPSPETTAFVRRLRAALGSRAHAAAHHSAPDRWATLYRLAWRRFAAGEPRVLLDPTDLDVRRLDLLAKAVRRDIHKMHAFVRFRRIDASPDAPERYVAWHRPEHDIVELAAPFFAARFGVMRWTIFTPRRSVDWDGDRLTFGPGVPASDVRADDSIEALWTTYYASIFNPARIKLSAMVKEMPKRHWATLPETAIITSLLAQAPERVRRMIERGLDDDRGAEPFVPVGPISLPVLRDAAESCAGCGLCELATRTVFGEGPAPAERMILGEQPGDEEDRAGRPFIGPAGRLLDDALAAADLDRTTIYVTNAVKHFHFETRGPRRIHKRPGPAHIRACAPWLQRELDIVNPRRLLLLGATAGQAMLGPGFRVHEHRGVWINHPDRPVRMLPTIHPSMILRTPEPDRPAALAAFIADLRTFAAP